MKGGKCKEGNERMERKRGGESKILFIFLNVDVSLSVHGFVEKERRVRERKREKVMRREAPTAMRDDTLGNTLARRSCRNAKCIIRQFYET